MEGKDLRKAGLKVTLPRLKILEILEGSNTRHLSAEDILAVLNRYQVDYVLIGAFAAIAQGVPLEATHDIDITPRREEDNLHSLSAALDELDARIRVDDLDEGIRFDHDAASLAGMAMLNLTCAAGDFDIVFSPAAAPSLLATDTRSSPAAAWAEATPSTPASPMVLTRGR